MSGDRGNEKGGGDEGTLTASEREVIRAIRAIRYGSIEITVHDARVVQIERREKVRVTVGAEKDRGTKSRQA